MPRRARDSGRVRAAIRTELQEVAGQNEDKQPSLAASSQKSVIALENVSLAFAKVDVEYKPQKADGSLDAGIHFKYDMKAQKEG